MSSIVLRSWEGTRVEFPQSAAQYSEFIKNCPDLTEEINLLKLEIDTSTLELIKEFLSLDCACPFISETITAETDIYQDQEKLRKFFENLPEESLDLLTLAAYKLDFKDLQRVCSYKIAQIFAEIPKRDLEKLFNIDELTIDEEDYMKYTWTKKPPK